MKATIDGVELEGDANEMASLLNQLSGKPKEVEQTRRPDITEASQVVDRCVADKKVTMRRRAKKGKTKIVRTQVYDFESPKWQRNLKKVITTVKKSSMPLTTSRAIKDTDGVGYSGMITPWFKEQLENTHGVKKVSNREFCSSALAKKLALGEIKELNDKPVVQKLQKQKRDYYNHPWHKFKREKFKQYAQSGMTFEQIARQVSLE